MWPRTLLTREEIKLIIFNVPGAPEGDNEELFAMPRLQVALAVGTGVFVIFLTTAVVMLMGQGRQSIPDSPNRPVAVSSSLAPRPSPTPSASPSPSATHSKRPTTAPPAPPTTSPPVATLASLTCSPTSIQLSEKATCTVTLTGPAHTNLTVNVVSSDGAVTVDGPVNFPAGFSLGSFSAERVGPGDATVTATLGLVSFEHRFTLAA